MYRASYEELVKLVKEHGTFEATPSDAKDRVLRVDLSTTGYSKKHNRLEVVLGELYPDYEPNFDINDIYPENDVFKIWLVDKNWRENWYNPLISEKEHWEQKALADIKESAEVILYGDTSLPDAEKEAVCKISFKLSDYSDYADIDLDDYEACEHWFYDTALRNPDTEFKWEDAYTHTVDGVVHVILISRALYRKRLQEFCESV